MKSRGQKAVMNTAVLGMLELVSFVSSLILPRFILLHFGSDYNGIVSSISQFFLFLTLLQMGISSSTRFALYKVLADNDMVGVSGILNATEGYMKKVGAFILFYIGIMAAFYPYIANTFIEHNEIRILVLLLGAGYFTQYFFGITYQILLIADQRQYIYNIIKAIALVVNLVVAIIIMEMGYSILAVELGTAVVSVLIPIVLYIVVKRMYKIDKKVPKNKIGLKNRWDALWHTVADVIHKNVGLAVLTFFADIKLVSIFTVHQLVLNGLFRVLSIFTSSLEAVFGNMLAKKETENAYKHLENYEFFMCSFISIVFSCALVLIVPFVKVYTKGVTDVNYIQPTFAAIAVIAQMILCIRQPYLTVVQAAGHYKQTRNGAFLEAGLNLVLTISLTPILGLVGVALGTFASNLVRTLQYIFYLSKNILLRPVTEPLKVIAWTAFNVTIVYFASNAVLSVLNMSNWLDWIIAGVCCFVIALAVTLVSARIFFNDKLKNLIKMLFNLMNKKAQA